MLTLCQHSLFSHMRRLRPMLVLAILLIPFLGLGACGVKTKAEYPAPQDAAEAKKYGTIGETLSGDGDGGITLFDSGRKRQAGQGATMGVNAYLWRAALDTVGFMPILSADSNGGTLLTDWYSPESTPNERLKLNVVIKDQTLRADGVTVTVFKQTLKGSVWRDATPNPAVGTQLEDTIVQRARQLRLQREGKQ